MTPRTFCASGQSEGAKAAVHGLLLVTAGVCAAYNVTAWLFRRERHLLINSIVYTGGVAWEAKKIRHHLRG